MASEHLKRHSASPVTREMQIRTTARTTHARRDGCCDMNEQRARVRARGGMGTCALLVGMQDGAATVGEHGGASGSPIEPPASQRSRFWVCAQRTERRVWKRYMCMDAHSSTIDSTEDRKQPAVH